MLSVMKEMRKPPKAIQRVSGFSYETPWERLTGVDGRYGTFNNNSWQAIDTCQRIDNLLEG